MTNPGTLQETQTFLHLIPEDLEKSESQQPPVVLALLVLLPSCFSSSAGCSCFGTVCSGSGGAILAASACSGSAWLPRFLPCIFNTFFAFHLAVAVFFLPVVVAKKLLLLVDAAAAAAAAASSSSSPSSSSSSDGGCLFFSFLQTTLRAVYLRLHRTGVAALWKCQD